MGGGIYMNLDDYRGVWVFIEQNDGKIEGVSLELLGAGRKLADKLQVPFSWLFTWKAKSNH